MTLDRLAAGARPYLLLALLTLAMALPGIATIPPLDRDESRFAVASREMIETGDFVTVHFQSEIRAKKPPGAYWLQAAAAELTGHLDDIWAYRIPSVLGILAAVLATFFFGRALVGAPAALIGAALLAVTPLVASEAHQAKTDALLLACVVIAQGALARFYLAARRNESPPGWRMALVFWLAQAAAILIKGPILPMVSALTIIALTVADRRVPRGWAWLKGLRALPGIALVVILVAPWAIAVSVATQGQFIAQAVGNDLIGKLIGAQESHAAPPGTYLLLATATLWPGAMFILPGLVRAIGARAEPALRFCLAWAIPAWLMFEIVPTKLPHYVLPCVPALVLLAGAMVVADGQEMKRGWAKLYLGVAAVIGGILALAAAIVSTRFGSGPTIFNYLFAVSVMAVGFGCSRWVLADYNVRAAGAAIGGTAFALALLFGGIMPGLDKLWLSQRIAELVPPGAPAATTGFREPSLIFLLGTKTKLTDASGAADFLVATPGAVAIVSAGGEQMAFGMLVDRLRYNLRLLGTVEGLNYSRGKPTTLHVWTLER